MKRMTDSGEEKKSRQYSFKQYKRPHKSVLVIASVASMIDQFNLPNIRLLQSMGCDVDVAANFEKGSTCADTKIKELLQQLESMSVDSYQIDFERKVTDLRAHARALKQLGFVLKGTAEPISGIRRHRNRTYDFIHAHSPVGGVLGRLAAKKRNVKIIYTAHGFHFYSGAPLKNWFIFYPIEKELSRITDVLITINREDYRRAGKRFHAKETVYIPGVGVDTGKFTACTVDRAKKRDELEIPQNAFVLLSVGELQDRKNHRTVIEALYRIKKPDIYYLIAGKGERKENYETLIKQYSLEKQVHLLGFRTDIDELCRAADCFVHPSIREGLGIAPLEAMASGLPLISAYINGIRDYTADGVTGCCVNPKSAVQMAVAIEKMYSDNLFRKKCGEANKKIAKRFDICRTRKIMAGVYGPFVNE